MSEKCFCHIDGVRVKDSTAREEIANVQKELTAMQNAEVIDSTARENIATITADVELLRDNLNNYNPVDVQAHERIDVCESDIDECERVMAEHETRLTAMQNAEVIDSTARNSIVGHETRITTIEGNLQNYSQVNVTLSNVNGVDKYSISSDNSAKISKQPSHYYLMITYNGKNQAIFHIGCMSNKYYYKSFYAEDSTNARYIENYFELNTSTGVVTYMFTNAVETSGEIIDTTARNSITGHETRITALENAGGGGGSSSGGGFTLTACDDSLDGTLSDIKIYHSDGNITSLANFPRNGGVYENVIAITADLDIDHALYVVDNDFNGINIPIFINTTPYMVFNSIGGGDSGTIYIPILSNTTLSGSIAD